MDTTRRGFMGSAAAFAAVGATAGDAGAKGKHVLVSYTWSIDNIGDMGIHTGLLTLFREKMPEVPVTMLNIFKEDTRNFRYYRENLPSYHPRFNLVACPFKFIIGGDPYTPRDERPNEGTARAKLEARWGKFRLEQFRQGCLPSAEAAKIADDLLNRFPLEVYADLQALYPKAAKAFDAAAFVYYNSGTTLNFGRLGVKNLYTFALPYSMSLLIARAKGIPYGIGSQSIDYVAWPLDLVYRTLFAEAEFVYNRDTDSINYLRQCGYKFKDNSYRPDTTVFFHRSDEAYADAFLAKHGLERDRFAIFVPRLPAYLDGKPSDMISHAVSPVRFEHQLAQMKEFIEKVTATGMKVVIAHETRDTVKGGLGKKYIWDRLVPAAQALTVYLDHFWTPEEALGVYKRTALLASEEMHSMIMAIGNEVPILHCPFAECGRKRQMIRDMGLGDRLVDIDEPDAGERMFRVFKEVTADLPGERERLRKTAEWLEGLATKTVEKVRAVVKRRGESASCGSLGSTRAVFAKDAAS